ncbi:MAG: M24 family metallopeptidase [Acidimicrobiia bacterium]|nr:M24 family metallopeptidase [Acidimicrobiia bacterium]
MHDPILSLRSQSSLRDEWLQARLDTIVPRVMERAGVDCWVLVAREYNEDPVVATMLPSTWLNARRRTILVFTDFGAERVAVSRYAVGEVFPAVWSADEQPDQWRRLGEYLEAKDPERIAVNCSTEFALADGFTATEFEAFRAALPARIRSRLLATEELAIGWLETRSPEEMARYPEVCARAHGILRRALSAEVIEPGITSTTDVEWWMRQEVADAGYESWFQPTVSIQRRNGTAPESFFSPPDGEIIVPGDLVHIDFGIVYLGLHTDQQQHAYVLEDGETSPPWGLVDGMAAGNRVQDLLMAEFAVGRSGNEVLAVALGKANEHGLAASIYSHPIGLHGHAAGPTIGLWDQQHGVPGQGDYPLWPDTAYSIELSVEIPLPEWDNQRVRIMLEEDAFFDGETVSFLDGRQTELWLI